MKEFWKSEWKGIIFTIILGCLLHFTYELSERNAFAALFSAVNESTWEHLKLLFFPYVIFALIRRFDSTKLPAVYSTANFLGVLSGLLFIPSVFYFYTAILGSHYPAVDISIFVLSVILSYFVSYTISVNNKPCFNQFSILLLTLIALIFFLFTFFPPQTPLFLDPVSGSYGIFGS